MQDADYRLYNWCSPDQRKIENLIDGGCNLVCVEVKSSTTDSAEEFKLLKLFSKDGPGRSRSCTGFVFYMRHKKLSFGDRVFALPVSTLWGNVED